MPVAARAAHVRQRVVNRRMWIARLHAQVHVNNRAAAIARNDEPIKFRNERGGNRGPRPNSLRLGFNPPVETLDSQSRIGDRSPVKRHCPHRIADFLAS